MKNKIVSLGYLLPVIGAIAFAAPEARAGGDSIYVGLGLGGAHTGVHFAGKGSALELATSFDDYSKVSQGQTAFGAAGEARIGYHIALDSRFSLPVEVYYLHFLGGKPGYSYAETSKNDASEASIQYAGGLRIRPGVKVNSDISVHAILGVAAASAKNALDASTAELATAISGGALTAAIPNKGEESKFLFGISYGLGVDYKLNHSLALRFDVSKTDFFSGSPQVETKVADTAHAAMSGIAGLSYITALAGVTYFPLA